MSALSSSLTHAPAADTATGKPRILAGAINATIVTGAPVDFISADSRPTLTAEDLALNTKIETIAQALMREKAKKIAEWMRDEIAREYQDAMPGQRIPADETLVEWATENGYSFREVRAPEHDPEYDHLHLVKDGVPIRGLRLRTVSFNVTAEEMAVIEKE